MQILTRTKYSALARLNKLVGPREITGIPEPQELLLNPPAQSVKPVSRIVLIVIAAAIGFWWLTRPTELTAIENLGTQPNSTSVPLSELVVHVTGEVVTPGLIKLPAGSRIADAITAAGGLLPGKTESGLNLAQHVEDGQLIEVGQSAIANNDKRINLNSATVEQLDELPGVGPVMADRIVSWRNTHKKFSRIEELQEVSGVGPKVFERLKDLVRV